MNDEELRALVRDAVARHLRSSGSQVLGSSGSRVLGSSGAQVLGFSGSAAGAGVHPSHTVYRIINVGEACVIEPSVTCDHCGYCKSHGH